MRQIRVLLETERLFGIAEFAGERKALRKDVGETPGGKSKPGAAPPDPTASRLAAPLSGAAPAAPASLPGATAAASSGPRHTPPAAAGPAIRRKKADEGAPRRGTTSPVPPEFPADVPEWRPLYDEAMSCTRCPLHATRTHVVFGVGNPKSPLLFIGEAPGADEDRQGEPFVGRAGQLLTKALRDLGRSRSEFYIANILKCRPPENRVPQPQEIVSCLPYLRRQIDLIRPRLICALGGVSAKTLLQTDAGIMSLRGRVHVTGSWRIFPTFHPAYILRNPADLPRLLEDLRTAIRLAEEKPADAAPTA